MKNVLNVYLEFLNDADKKVTKFVNVSGAIILKQNEEEQNSILLIRRSPTDHWKLIWEYPRGKCSSKENLEKCLKREVKEETGLDVDIIKYIDQYDYIADHGTRKSTQHNFLCKMSNPKQKVKLSFEHDQYKWVSSVGEVELLVPAEMKKTISKVLNTYDQIVNYRDNMVDKEKIGE